jgi:hypothetical protein
VKATVKIPKGWRRLRWCTSLQMGQDRWLNKHDMTWPPCSIPGRVGIDFSPSDIYIRRKAPQQPRRKV